ncbi:CocE/NonD family hydrolase [Paenibacillus oralis]|uniref:CocE/NonD family hydrolase n=1 Tax=Paenibacillus oralis TaxID=2490856 RepID=A0A3P3UCD2_9BACL|nr:CocE/NonD family hydrolase [Paenibacillus oralis]RRJ67199.1 CocE/NonD family hydrolase [Paenibacillus oralis]
MSISIMSIPADDEVLLSCLIAVPDEDGPFPVIVTRTPYDKMQFAETAKGWTSAGFAFVAQDVRGRYGSEGEWLPYHDEEADGLCTLRWVIAQAWCNGQVALEGSSYGAFAAYAAVQGDEQGLISSLITLVPAMGLRETAFHSSGAFHLLDRLWWEASFGTSGVSAQERFWEAYARCPDAIWHLPVKELPLVFPMELRHWPRAIDPEAEQETIRLSDIRRPVMHIGGWHDAFIGALLNNYRSLSERADPRPQSLIIGPWTHEVNKTPRYEARSYGPHARLPLAQMEINWLRHTLKGEPLSFPSVLIFAMGRGRWIAPPAWPLPGTITRTFYLTGKGMRLQEGLPDREEPYPSCHYRYDPAHPLPAREYPSFRQDLDARSDVLCYTSDPLDEGLLLAGSACLRLWVGSTASQTDFYACLSEVDSSDSAIYITSGLARCVSAAVQEAIAEQEAEISLKPVCQWLPRGSRIRISISSSCFPEYARSLNTLGDSLHQTRFVPADQTVWHDVMRPSCLMLPCHNDALERWYYENETSV